MLFPIDDANATARKKFDLDHMHPTNYELLKWNTNDLKKGEEWNEISISLSDTSIRECQKKVKNFIWGLGIFGGVFIGVVM